MNAYETLDKYRLFGKLDEKSDSVTMHAKDMETGKEVALKIVLTNGIMRSRLVSILLDEVAMVNKLNHPSIVHFVDESCFNGIRRHRNGKTVFNTFVVMEFPAHGDFDRLLFYAGAFDENLARFYFKQLLDVVEFLHKKNLIHRDLKLKNLMLDNELNLRLTGFDFAIFIKDDQEKQEVRVGTPPYMAPENYFPGSFKLKKADIFSLGVILFKLVSNRLPFKKASWKDPLCDMFLENRENFWSYHENRLKPFAFSKDLRTLISRMLTFNFDKRSKFSEIRANQWLKEPIDEVLAKNSMRLHIMKKQAALKDIEAQKNLTELSK